MTYLHDFKSWSIVPSKKLLYSTLHSIFQKNGDPQHRVDLEKQSNMWNPTTLVFNVKLVSVSLSV